VANDYGVTHGLTVEQLLEDKPEVVGEVVRMMRRPHGNITQVFFYIFNTADCSTEEIVGTTLSLNGL
jgi:hypothetical protein